MSWLSSVLPMLALLLVGLAQSVHGQECVLEGGFADLAQARRDGRLDYKQGGLGNRATSEHRTWVCVRPHPCALTDLDRYCFKYNTALDKFDSWGRNVDLKLCTASGESAGLQSQCCDAASAALESIQSKMDCLAWAANSNARVEGMPVTRHYDSGVCGDGILQGHEECDDGNTAGSDGCSSNCTVETGFSCSAQMCLRSLCSETTGGTEVWSTESFRRPTELALSSDGSYAYVCDDYRNVYQVRTSDGAQMWQTDQFFMNYTYSNGAQTVTKTHVTYVWGSPALSSDGSHVYMGYYGGTLRQFRTSSNGTMVWEFDPGFWAEITSVVPVLSFDGSSVYISMRDSSSYLYESNLYKLRTSDGTQVWSFAAGEGTPALSSDGSYVYIMSYDAPVEGSYLYNFKLNKLRTSDGTMVWSSDIQDQYTWSSPLSLTPDGSFVVHVGENSLSKLRTSDGVEEWSFRIVDFEDTRIRGGATWSPDGSHVYFMSEYRGYDHGDIYRLHKLRTSDGAQIWTFTIASYRVSTPTLSSDGSHVYIGSEDKLYKVRTSDGAMSWSFATEDDHDDIQAAPTLSPDGSHVYIVTDSYGGNLYKITA